MRLVAALLSLSLASPALAAASGGTLVVLNKSDHTASLLSLPGGEVRATLPTGHGPHEVAVSPDGATAVVSNYGTREQPGKSLTVLDVAGARQVADVDLGEYRRPHGLAWLADGKTLAVTVEGSRALLLVDVAAAKVLAAIPTEQEVSHMVAVAPGAGGGRAFVANIGSGSVSVLDLAERRLVRNLKTGAGAEGIDVTPDGAEVWITNREGDTVTVVDARSLETRATLPCKAFPIRVKITPDGKRALVSNARSGDVAVFEVASRREVGRIAMQAAAVDGAGGRLFGDQFGQGPVPVGILVAPDGSRAYVANTNADQVTVLDLQGLRVEGRLTAGREPDGLGYSTISRSE
jgi:YVTN family beta-propeller protein